MILQNKTQYVAFLRNGKSTCQNHKIHRGKDVEFLRSRKCRKVYATMAVGSRLVSDIRWSLS